jgi:membrane protease YdiL (CAAX protease family)
VVVWTALVTVLAGAVALAGAERMLLRRLAGDRRRLDVQRRARRAGLWLLAAGHVAVAHAGAVAAAVAGADALAPGGTVAGPAVVAGVVAVVVGVAGVVAVLARPALGVLAPGLVTAAAQELVFRGAVLGLLVEAGAGAVTAVGVVALAFTATRLPRGGRAAAAALVAGVVLGAVTLAVGSVLVAVALHAAALVVVAGLGDRAARLAEAAATAGVGCGGHDPASPACQACPLAPAAAGARA